MSSESSTCAVLVIHGVGEQRPMGTLRGFVEGVLNDEEADPKFFSKFDALAETLELRKLQNRHTPRIHFFEYYWAYKAQGTKLAHVLRWLRSLLFRLPTRNKVPPHLRFLFGLCWATVILVVLGIVLGAAEWMTEARLALPWWVGWALGTVVVGIVDVVVLGYVGDAARYLSSSPANIKMRQAIRSEGVRLLRKLHEKGYGRIVVVGHSLGSVIAYDVLKNLWVEYDERYEKPCRHAQGALADNEAEGRKLAGNWRVGEPMEADPDAYRAAQKELALELRSLGCGWRVTDLITLGSPLAHAAVLLATDLDDLDRRQEERELPTCPPKPEIGSGGAWKFGWDWYEFKYSDAQGDYQLRYVHDEGLFACTRWTNCYFPAWLGFFGDFVGGPMRPVFGPGIRDVAVTTRKLLVRRTLRAHLRYWSLPQRPDDANDNALEELTLALDLEDASFL